MTKDELLAAFDDLKAKAADFAQPRVLGAEIVEADGARRGMFETVVNGEEHVVGYVHHFLELARSEATKLEGRQS